MHEIYSTKISSRNNMELVVKIQLIFLTLFHTLREIRFWQSLTVVYKLPVNLSLHFKGDTFSRQTLSYPEMSFVATCIRIWPLLCGSVTVLDMQWVCVRFIHIAIIFSDNCCLAGCNVHTHWLSCLSPMGSLFLFWKLNSTLGIETQAWLCVSFKLGFGLLVFFLSTA